MTPFIGSEPPALVALSQPQLQSESAFLFLPFDVQVCILRYLSVLGLHTFSLVSKECNTIVSELPIWRKLSCNFVDRSERVSWYSWFRPPKGLQTKVLRDIKIILLGDNCIPSRLKFLASAKPGAVGIVGDWRTRVVGLDGECARILISECNLFDVSKSVPSANGYILMFDVDKRASWEILSRFFGQLIKSCPKFTQLALVGNRVDRDWKVSIDEVHSFCEKANSSGTFNDGTTTPIPFIEVSRLYPEGIEFAFRVVAERYHSSQKSTVVPEK
eukprot:TRINITY_DN8565_c0_g1_i1.p1 TRINITY_DN8565_c0_g1~~TRINITY_DN8565_c0_g1_i1.p1  ORF type:complete len:293 (+),score=41.63 TRINITY_DN8565_c0_g1_i1:62-880(+)